MTYPIHGVTGKSTDGVLSPSEQQALDTFQREMTQKVLSYWQSENQGNLYPALALPTGIGKGRIARMIYEATSPATTGVIVGTKNVLVQQMLDVLGATNNNCLDASILPDEKGRILVSQWQGWAAYKRRRLKRKESLRKLDLLIVDEVHNTGTASRVKLLKELHATHVFGQTATAYRASGELSTPEDYGFTVVGSATLPWCIQKGWLPPLVGIVRDSGVTLPADVLSGKAINTKKLYRELRKKPEHFRAIADDLAADFLPKGMKTVIVVNRIREEACVIARQLQEHGFRVGLAVNQHDSEILEREGFITNDALLRYKLAPEDPDSIQIIISPQVIAEGFDAPMTELVVWTVPTLSGLRYTQINGRGSRRCIGKAYCIVLDYAYLIEGYGYSLNFAQFFRKEKLVEISPGVYYLGPQSKLPQLPDDLRNKGRLVDVLNTNKHKERGEKTYSITQLAAIFRFGGKQVLSLLLTDLGIRPIPGTDRYNQATYDQISTISSAWLTTSELSDRLELERHAASELLDYLTRGCEDTVKLHINTKGYGNKSIWSPTIQAKAMPYKGWCTAAGGGRTLGITGSDFAAIAAIHKPESLILWHVTLYQREFLDLLRGQLEEEI